MEGNGQQNEVRKQTKQQSGFEKLEEHRKKDEAAHGPQVLRKQAT